MQQQYPFSLTGRKKTKDFENNITKSGANGTNFFHSSRRNAFHLSIEIQEASGERMAVLGKRNQCCGGKKVSFRTFLLQVSKGNTIYKKISNFSFSSFGCHNEKFSFVISHYL